MEDPVEGANRAESLGGVEDLLSLSYLLDTKKVTWEQAETDRVTAAPSLQERLQLYIKIMAMTYIKVLESNYSTRLVYSLGLKFLEL